MAAPVPLPFAVSERSTIGIEWEVALVDADSGDLRQAAQAVLAAVRAEYGTDHPNITQELLLNTIEVQSGKCRTVAEAAVDLQDALDQVRRVAEPLRIDLMGEMHAANLYAREADLAVRLSRPSEPGLAARRLGADVLDFSPGGSSTAKGETFIDTAKNIEAMGIDMVVVRHSSPGAPHVLAKHLKPHVRVVNAGDGAHEHPTQALLDIFPIRQRLGRVAGLTVGLIGDTGGNSNMTGFRATLSIRLGGN